MTDEDLKKIQRLIKEELQPINNQLSDKETGLKAINTRLNDPETGLNGINFKIDNITAELSQVHKLTKSTYDLVKLEPQKRRQEINEIREQVGLPISPVDLS